MLKRYTRAMSVLLMLCTVATAAVGRDDVKVNFVAPEQVIIGAEKNIPLGKLVRLRVSPLVKSPEYLSSSAYQWKVFEYDDKTGDLMELDDVVEMNGCVVFGAGIVAKKLKAMCICTYLFMVKDDKQQVREVATRTVVLTATITIGNPIPPPGPGPGPTPVPPPDLPDGQFKLARAAYQSATKAVVNPASRTKGAVALAKSYRGIASAISAGTIMDIKTALTKTKSANNQALSDAGIPLSEWNDFGTAMQDAVYLLYDANQIRNAADLAVAWLEVANGLERVR